ncbi:LOW QUALITY PROTEIN: tumor-associated calcium signal transducer 2 [Amazona ochrocephala]
MEPVWGFAGFVSGVPPPAQNNCTCGTNKWMVCVQHGPENCIRLAGSNHKVDCSRLTSRCLLMKAEMILCKEKRFWGHPHRLLSNNGTMIPEGHWHLQSRQCSHIDACRYVNNAVRTEKGDENFSCGELIRTNWIYIELKHKTSSAFVGPDVVIALKHLFERYSLHPKYITAGKYMSPVTQICLNQHEKSRCSVDIADVVYYFERDTKDDSIFHFNSTIVCVNGDALDITKLQIYYYVDEKPPEFCMQQLGAGFGAVVTVVVLAAGMGITVLALLRWLNTRKYEKGIKQMAEIGALSLQL